MKKILIFYASYGGGHLNAAKSIKQYIDENYPEYEAELIDCMKYVNKPIERITTAAYREMAKKIPWAWGKMYNDSQKESIMHITSKTSAFFAIKMLKLLREKNPELVISTHPFGSQMCSYLKRKGKISVKVATILTDFAAHDQWILGHEFINYYFVSNEKMKKYLISKNIPENSIFITGIPISNRFLKIYDKKEILNTLNFSENKKTVLFFGGGAFGLGESHTVNIFRTLVQNFDNIQIIAISGKNKKMNEIFLNIVKENHKEDEIKVLEFTDKVPELMSISDFVVSKPGGLTTSETLASGLPIIVIDPIPGQEEENAKFLEANGAGIWIKDDESALDIFQNIINNQVKLNEMKKNAENLAKRHSTENVCKILLDNK